MTSATFALLAGAVSLGPPLALAVYEIIVLRRGGRDDGDDGRRGHEPQPKPLPDCLQPHVLLSRRKLAELADA